VRSRGRVSFLSVVFFTTIAFWCIPKQQVTGQSVYPGWFLNPGLVQNNNMADACITPSYYADSSASIALQKARSNWIRDQKALIRGLNMFWATEAGTYWVHTEYEEEIDSSLIMTANEFRVLDIYRGKKIVIVLSGDKSATVTNPSLLKCVPFPKEKPKWIEDVPKDDLYVYAVGAAPSYFYEPSSWDEATEHARKELARSILVKTSALHKNNEFEGQEQREENVEVVMKNFQVVKRWREEKQGFFYVLARIPR
jgi:hypothetical protein